MCLSSVFGVRCALGRERSDLLGKAFFVVKCLFEEINAMRRLDVCLSLSEDNTGNGTRQVFCCVHLTTKLMRASAEHPLPGLCREYFTRSSIGVHLITDVRG